jgi:hypothetical protein
MMTASFSCISACMIVPSGPGITTRFSKPNDLASQSSAVATSL